jgi:hypothetical protein
MTSKMLVWRWVHKHCTYTDQCIVGADRCGCNRHQQSTATTVTYGARVRTALQGLRPLLVNCKTVAGKVVGTTSPRSCLQKVQSTGTVVYPYLQCVQPWLGGVRRGQTEVPGSQAVQPIPEEGEKSREKELTVSQHKTAENN